MAEPPNAGHVVLVSMPWADAAGPSIQIGILHAALLRSGIRVTSRSYHLRFLDYLIEHSRDLPEEERFTHADYREVLDSGFNVGLGDWIFSLPPYEEAGKDQQPYIDHLSNHGLEPFLPKLWRMRELAPAFLEACLRDTLALKPSVVGFTMTFNIVPALVLAKMLKAALPEVKIVVGGSSCDGVMGEALHRAHRWVDVVVRGEGEAVLGDLVHDLAAGDEIQPRPGLIFWRGGEQVMVEEGSSAYWAMNDIPTPNYDEYFEFLDSADLGVNFRYGVFVPFKTARGCWWGQKTQCTFCGISSTLFDCKHPDVALAELIELARKYRAINLMGTDWIIEHGYFDTLLPKLAAAKLDLSIFWEMKANLKRHQVRTLRDAGVVRIQPGIESLSSPVLKLMRKGVSALSNIRLLKWCHEYGISVFWNLLFGFPNESAREFLEMVDLIPSLVHLPPPSNAGAIAIDRFSVYHQRPEDYPELTITGPLKHYELLYDIDRLTALDMAYRFEHTLVRRDHVEYEASLHAAVDAWKNAYKSTRSPCFFERGPDFLRFYDARFGETVSEFELSDHEAIIYLACDEGATVDALSEQLPADISSAELTEFLDELVEEKLMYREDGRYLSLATARNPDRVYPARDAAHGKLAMRAQRALPLHRD